MKLTLRGGTWHVTFTDALGKRQRKSTHHSDRERAEARAKDIVREHFSTPPGGEDALTMRELLNQVYHSHWSKLKSAKVQKFMVFRLCLDREIGPVKLTDITYARLHTYCERLMRDVELGGEGLSPATVNRRMSTVSAALKRAARLGLVTQCPEVPRFAENNVRERYLSIYEEAVVSKFLDGKRKAELVDPMCTGEWTYMHALFIVLLDSGCRLSEVLRAQAGDLRCTGKDGNGKEKYALWLKHGTTKSDKARMVPLTTRAQEAVKALFASKWHGKVDSDWCGWRWLTVRKACGIADCNLHILRHTCASRLIERGVSIYTVSKWLGHSSVTVTERYAHLAPTTLDAALTVLEAPQAAHVETLHVSPKCDAPHVQRLQSSADCDGESHKNGDDILVESITYGAKGGTRTLTGLPTGT